MTTKIISSVADKHGEVMVRLEPDAGARLINGELHAVELPYWLRIEPVKSINRHRWIRLRYSSGFFDEPVRPLIRFLNSKGKEFVQPMNGAILGCAEWIGRVPDGTVSIFISPGRRLGPIAFRIDALEGLSRQKLVRDAIFADTPWLLWSLRSRLLNSREEAWQALKYARGGTVFERYWEWCARLTRPLEFNGLDKPRANWLKGPNFRLFSRIGECDAAALRATLASLREQAYSSWTLHIRVDARSSRGIIDTLRGEMHGDPRICLCSFPQDHFAASEHDWAAVIRIGDTLPNYALAVLVEAIADMPDLEVIYSDEDSIGANGLLRAPIFKPNWSPVLYKSRPYLGRLLLFRVATLKAHDITAESLLSDENVMREHVLDNIEPRAVYHVRRVLYHRKNDTADEVSVTGRRRAAEIEWPDVSVIVPTRDRVDLVAVCTRGLKERTDYENFGVIIVDNGSVRPETRKLLADLGKDPRFNIMERPGPFNYAKLCNDGARACQSRILVFLNNDVDIIEAGWLKALVRWAVRPRVGAVGAKLLFPNGRIQHAGVVLGMGGIAGHVYRRGARNAAGYLHQLETVREVAAVTGACMAVERSKFEAVNGFDEQNLPIDLNDIDFCLRLAERGWTTIWTPEAVLTHLQSASRGVERDPFKIYQKERTYFVHRWAEMIRDDPYFHPGIVSLGVV